MEGQPVIDSLIAERLPTEIILHIISIAVDEAFDGISVDQRSPQYIQALHAHILRTHVPHITNLALACKTSLRHVLHFIETKRKQSIKDEQDASDVTLHIHYQNFGGWKPATYCSCASPPGGATEAFKRNLAKRDRAEAAHALAWEVGLKMKRWKWMMNSRER